MPSGYDAEVAELFRDLRAASNLSETDLAQRLGARIEVVQALEQGALYALPPWPETCRIVNGYGALLNLDIRPLLRRIYAQLEAGIVQLGPKTMPEMPVLHPPEDADFEADRPAPAPPANNSQWPGASQQPSQNAWPQQAQQPQPATWPPAMPQHPPPQQAAWPGYAPQPQPQQPAWPNGGQQGMPQAWQSAPQPQPQPQARPDGQAQQRPAQTYAQQPQPQAQPQAQPQVQPQAQAPQPQPQQRPAPQEQPQLAAPATKAKPPKPERAARSSAWLLKWGLGALVVSVVAFGLWIAFGDPSGTLGGKSLSPSGSGQVLDPDDPRSRKADKLPSAF
jgi:transcriptional regulator with XRE-family HTH domain